MQIEFVNVGSVTAVPGKKYSTIEVAYKKDGKVEGKKLLSFTNPQVFSDVQKYKQGDVVDITTTKNDQGYWQWDAITAGVAGATTVPAGTSTVATQASPTKVVSNYETKEERASRQQLIINQSSISSAVAFYTGKKAEIKDVFNLASQFADFVNNGGFKAAPADFFGDEDLVL